MREIAGDIWDYRDAGFWIGITTNGEVKSGANVMGRGVAQQAKEKIAGVAELIGRRILANGNHVSVLEKERLFTFPVKDRWRFPATLDLIMQSGRELAILIDAGELGQDDIYLVRPGCGSGGLRWREVKPVLAASLGAAVQRVTIVDRVA